jgi:hypothetical protein
LADAVILVFQPTTAHQQGLIDVVQEIRKREQNERRPIPRLYVASKVHEVYEGELDPESDALLEALVRSCEGSSEFAVAPTLEELEYCHDWVNPRVPTLHCIRNRERVKGQHIPDAYVVHWGGAPDNESTWEYGAVSEWIEATSDALARHHGA